MGLLAHEYASRNGDHTYFKGLAAGDIEYAARFFEYHGCSNAVSPHLFDPASPFSAGSERSIESRGCRRARRPVT